jgi:hypothetical protein
MEVLASALAAKADNDEQQLEIARREHAALQRQFYSTWRGQDIDHRKLMKQWKLINFKRQLVDSKSKELTMLAELGGLIAGFQMIMFFENQLVDPGTYWFADALLAISGVLALFVSCLNIFIMVFASIINFQVIIDVIILNFERGCITRYL